MCTVRSSYHTLFAALQHDCAVQHRTQREHNGNAHKCARTRSIDADAWIADKEIPRTIADPGLIVDYFMIEARRAACASACALAASDNAAALIDFSAR